MELANDEDDGVTGGEYIEELCSELELIDNEVWLGEVTDDGKTLSEEELGITMLLLLLLLLGNTVFEGCEDCDGGILSLGSGVELIALLLLIIDDAPGVGVINVLVAPALLGVSRLDPLGGRRGVVEEAGSEDTGLEGVICTSVLELLLGSIAFEGFAEDDGVLDDVNGSLGWLLGELVDLPSCFGWLCKDINPLLLLNHSRNPCGKPSTYDSDAEGAVLLPLRMSGISSRSRRSIRGRW